MKKIFLLLKRIAIWELLRMLRRYRLLSLGLLRIRGAKLYVKSVDSLRNIVLGMVFGIVSLLVLLGGFLLLHIGAGMVMYHYTGNLLWTALLFVGLGAIYFVLPMIFIASMLSERRWMRWFRVGRVLRFATGRASSPRR